MVFSPSVVAGYITNGFQCLHTWQGILLHPNNFEPVMAFGVSELCRVFYFTQTRMAKIINILFERLLTQDIRHPKTGPVKVTKSSHFSRTRPGMEAQILAYTIHLNDVTNFLMLINFLKTYPIFLNFKFLRHTVKQYSILEPQFVRVLFIPSKWGN